MYLLAYVVIILIIDNIGPLPRLNTQLYRWLPGLKSNTILCTVRMAAVESYVWTTTASVQFLFFSIWNNVSMYGYLPTLERCLNTSIFKVNL